MSRKKLRVTNHARVRVKERLNISSKKNISKVLNDALLFGHPAADYFGDFADYLKYNKSKYSDHTGLKVYLNYMVFYHNKTIITTYKVPKKFLPCEKYLRRNSLYTRCPYLKRLYDLVGYDKVEYEQFFPDKEGDPYVTGLVVNGIFDCFGLGTDKFKSLNHACRQCVKRILKESEENNESKPIDDPEEV